MTAERLNEALKLDYLDPLDVLTDSNARRSAVQKFGARLSENDRKNLLEEMVQAAAWCAGMSQLWKRPVVFSPGERYGADAVIAIGGLDHGLIGWLQLKQQPEASRSTIGLQELIDKTVGKYSDPESTYLAFAVNRSGEEIDFAKLSVEGLRGQVLEVWVYGRGEGSDWFFCGDMLEGKRSPYRVEIQDTLPTAVRSHDRSGDL